MACGGYDDKRFPNSVKQDIHCIICLGVLKEPKQCERNEHHFCNSCITCHLEMSSKCPTCQDNLTIETLKKASRYLVNDLSELEITCDNKGCREVVKLGDLQTHLDNNCEFTLVQCSNNRCNELITRKDKVLHENVKCLFKKSCCNNCNRLEKRLLRYKIFIVCLIVLIITLLLTP